MKSQRQSRSLPRRVGLFSAVVSVFVLTGHAEPSFAGCEDPTDPRYDMQSRQPLSSSSDQKTSQPSIFAAADMAAKGVGSGYNALRGIDDIRSECKPPVIPDNLWYEKCNPDGIKASLDRLHGQYWLIESRASGGGAMTRPNLANMMATYLSRHGTPILFPMNGQGNHWGTMWFMQVTKDSPTGQPTEVCNIKLNDAIDPVDPSYVGPDWQSGDDFLNKFMHILDRVGMNCPDATGKCSDQYFKKYLFLYDPPRGLPLVSETDALNVRFSRAPALIPQGQTLSLEEASRQVFRAIELAGLGHQPEIIDVLQHGVPGEAFPVVARFPEGEPRRYIVVPIEHADRHTQRVLGFVRLDAIDGAFLGISLVAKGATYQPVNPQVASMLAASQLQRGEALGVPALHWSAAEYRPEAQKLWQAFYEFPIERGGTTTDTVIRVARNRGVVLGRRVDAGVSSAR